MINRQWLLTSRPVGLISEDNFKRHETKVPLTKDNQVLVKNVYLSFDPTQRIWSSIESYVPIIELNDVMRAFGLGQVLESKQKGFKKGDLVFYLAGWQDYCLIDFNEKQLIDPMVIPSILDPKVALALSITGLTAYFGLLDIAKLKADELVLVSGAAGAVGSMVCQLAKLKNARVVGLAGSDEKCKWLVDSLQVDAAINYKKDPIEEKLDMYCDNKIDIYFDNVGGEMLDRALARLNEHARIVLCGAISQYNEITEEALDNPDAYGPKLYANLIIKNSKMEGFVVTDYASKFQKGLMDLTRWIGRGDISCNIDLQTGFENIPNTLQRLFTGENKGKQLLQLCELPLPLNKNFITDTLIKLINPNLAKARTKS